MQNLNLRGMRAFQVVWVGQLVSLLGTSMTGFALPIWIFGKTERVQEMAIIGLCFMLPLLIVSPFAGAIVDRSNRKLMMMVSDFAAGLMTIVVWLLVVSGRLEIWHLYITAAISGTFQTFQWPAYSAAISMMLPKEQYGRAHGLLSLAEAGSGIFAPVLAGALLGFVGLQGILLIDVVSFIFAILTLSLVHIPQPAQTEAGRAGQGSIWKESVYGFHYILQRPSLLGLQIVFLLCNFIFNLSTTTFAAMILARSEQNELIFGSVQSVGAVGGIVGAAMMSAWGGPKRRVHGVLAGWAFSGFSAVLLGLGRGLYLWAIAIFLGAFIGPIINGSNQAIWQAKVAPDVQGRVFSIRRLIAWGVSPLATLLAIPLADSWLGPAMLEGGSLAGTFGWLVGVGPGAGMSLLYVFSGLLLTMVGLGAYLFSVVRLAEDLLPDHDAVRGDVAPAG